MTNVLISGVLTVAVFGCGVFVLIAGFQMGEVPGFSGKGIASALLGAFMILLSVGFTYATVCGYNYYQDKADHVCEGPGGVE